MLNYGLSTKLYITSFSETSFKSENPILIGQVWPIPDKFDQGFHRTSPVSSSDKSGAPGYKFL
jgi:hypothetical protein